MLRKSIRLFVQNRFLFGRNKQNSKQPQFSEREAGDTEKSVMNDLFDAGGFQEIFAKRNQEIREAKLKGMDEDQINHKEVEGKIRQLLGKNFERYANTTYEIEGKDSKGYFEPYTEYIAATRYNQELSIGTRGFPNENQLRKMRTIESQGWQGVKDVYPESPNYPVNDLKSVYQIDDLLGGLQENELAVFNIPLDVDKENVKQFLMQNKLNPLQVEIKTCKLNLNSYAIVSFENKIEAKSLLSQIRFNGCVLDVLGKEDQENENGWDRTLVVFNLNSDLSHQDILHWVSQFGRVHNCLIPMIQANPDLPTEDELIKALERDRTSLYPAKITVYDIETNKVEKRFWPSEADFLETIKRQKESFETLSDHQTELLNKEIEQRLLFLKSEREYHCLRVPIHLKESFTKLWVPTETNEEYNYLQTQLEKFFSKKYINLGFTLVTYSTKLLAQRALYNITARNSKDISYLQLPLHNQIEFTKLRPEPHSNEDHYGHQFRVTETMLHYNDQPNAMKTWEGMELYHIDSNFIIHQLENFRKQVANEVGNVRDHINKENEMEAEGEFKEKQNDLRQRIFKELSEPVNALDFDDRIKSKSFTEKQDFEDSYVKKIGQKPGRKFIASISELEYKDQVSDLISLANKNQTQQEKFVEDLLNKNQKENIKDIKKEQEAHVLKASSDPVVQEYQQRLTGKYSEQRKELNQFINAYDQSNQVVQQMIDNEEATIQASEKKTLDGKARIKKIQEQKNLKLNQKPSQEFSSFKKPAELESQAYQDQKQLAFLQELKRIMFGTYTNQEKEEFFQQKDSNYDLLQYAQQYSKDLSGREYLDENIIEKVREFELPLDENQRLKIRKQEFNRKYLISQIPPNSLVNLQKKINDSFTQSLFHEIESGTVTESFDVEKGQDGQQIADELNKFVAGRGEKYHFEVDPQTKKEYIVKSEKPFYMYDLEVISQFEDKDETAEIVEMIINKFQLPKYQAEKIVQDSITTGQIHPYIQKLYEESLEDNNNDIDIEKTIEEFGMTKKELDLHLTTNIFKQQDLFEKEISEQIMKEQLILQNKINKDSIIRTESPQLKIKTPKGKYKVPKYKQF